MSCDIRKYQPTAVGANGKTLTLTAYVGQGVGRSIQFTIGSEYCGLDEDALLDMIETIIKRLRFETGYTATGEERDKIGYETTP